MNLTDALRTLADQAPTPVAPPDLYRRAIRDHRRRVAVRGAVLTVVVLLLSVGYGLQPRSTGTSPGSPGSPAAGLPRSVHAPPLRTATIGQSAPGPSAMIFGGPATTDDWNEGRFGVVAAADDTYRVYDGMPYQSPGFESLLSPDGRLLATSGSVISLVDDDSGAFSYSGEPLAFSPDSSLLVYEWTEGTTDVGGREVRRAHVVVFDLASKRRIARIDTTDGVVAPGWGAAVSPDNRRLALRVGIEFRLYDLTVGGENLTPYLRFSSGPLTRLAGPGAWQPDGESFAVVRFDDVSTGSWQLFLWSGSTPGLVPLPKLLPDVAGARYVRVIGWRRDGTAVALVGMPRTAPSGGLRIDDFDQRDVSPFRDRETVRVRIAELVPGSDRVTYTFETPDGIRDLDVAADLAIAGAYRDTGPGHYGPLHALMYPLIFVILIVVAAPVALIVLWRKRVRPSA